MFKQIMDAAGRATAANQDGANNDISARKNDAASIVSANNTNSSGDGGAAATHAHVHAILPAHSMTSAGSGGSGGSTEDNSKNGNVNSKNNANKHIRFLVVDDDSGQRIVLKSILVREGYTVDMADDGDKAVAMVQKTLYNVVLMDGLMPNMTGMRARDTQSVRVHPCMNRLCDLCHGLREFVYVYACIWFRGRNDTAVECRQMTRVGVCRHVRLCVCVGSYIDCVGDVSVSVHEVLHA